MDILQSRELISSAHKKTLTKIIIKYIIFSMYVIFMLLSHCFNSKYEDEILTMIIISAFSIILILSFVWIMFIVDKKN